MSGATERECTQCGARQWVGDIIVGRLRCDVCGAVDTLRLVVPDMCAIEGPNITPSGLLVPSSPPVRSPDTE